jgi:hypothetical protein
MLKHCNIYDTFHVSKLKPTTDDFFPNRPDAALPKPAKGSAEDIYEVEAILDRDFKYNVLYYLVHWKGHSHIYANDWIPHTELHRSAKQILNKYENKHGIDISKPMPLATIRSPTLPPHAPLPPHATRLPHPPPPLARYHTRPSPHPPSLHSTSTTNAPIFSNFRRPSTVP